MGTKVVIFSGSRGFWFVLCAGVLLSSLCGQRRKVTKKKAAGYACSLLRSWFWLNVLKLASLGQSHVFYAKTARFVLRSCAEAGFLRGDSIARFVRSLRLLLPLSLPLACSFLASPSASASALVGSFLASPLASAGSLKKAGDTLIAENASLNGSLREC